MNGPARRQRVLMCAGDLTFVQDWASCVSSFADVTLTHDSPMAPPTTGTFAWRPFPHRRWRPTRIFRQVNLRHDTRAVMNMAKAMSSTTLHSHFYSTAASFERAAERTGMPLVHTEHSGALQTGTFSQAGLKSLMRVADRATCFIAVSNSLRDALAGLGIARDIEVVPNPLDDSWFERATHPGDGDHPIYISIGWLEKHKNHRILVQAFALVKRHHAGATLRIIGDGPEMPALKSLIDDLALGDSVQLLGRLDRSSIQDELLRADVYVHSSYSETFGVALVEAWASGLPVVCFSCGGVSELAPQFAGIALTTRSIDELGRAMSNLAALTTAAERRRIQDKARLRFARSSVSKMLADIYPQP